MPAIDKILAERPFFTVIDPATGDESRIGLSPLGLGVQIDGASICAIDKQQLAEFAAFLMAFSDLDDEDSVVELLDGYGFNSKQLDALGDKFLRLAKVCKDES